MPAIPDFLNRSKTPVAPYKGPITKCPPAVAKGAYKTVKEAEKKVGKVATKRPVKAKRPDATKVKAKAKAAPKVKAKAKTTDAPRESFTFRKTEFFGKQAALIRLASRANGATKKELCNACGWPEFSATLGKMARRAGGKVKAEGTGDARRYTVK
jgi:hypothetical protein